MRVLADARHFQIATLDHAGSKFVTRLHVRYDGDHFPEDLVFQTPASFASMHPRTGELC